MHDSSTYEVTTISITLPDILQFITGCQTTPPVGFIPSPSVRFHDTSIFPMANTCTNTLHLPMDNVNDSIFKYRVLSGFVNSPGFGRV